MVHAAFVLGVLGWGIGFYGLIFLSVVRESTGWPLTIISSAVSLHFLLGAITGAHLPTLHRRFTVPTITNAGGSAMGAGIIVWGMAAAPWHLFVAGTLTGAGWGIMGAALPGSSGYGRQARRRGAAIASTAEETTHGHVLIGRSSTDWRRSGRGQEHQ